MKLFALALTAAVAVGFIPSPAYADITARRLWLLCNAEDPSCGTLLRQAFNDFLANPTLTSCTYEKTQDSVYNERHRCWEHTGYCRFVGDRSISTQQLFLEYMSIVPMVRDYWGWSPRAMMYVIMKGGCR